MMLMMAMGMAMTIVSMTIVDDVNDVDFQVNIAMTATYMIFGLSLFWMVFHLVQVSIITVINFNNCTPQ